LDDPRTFTENEIMKKIILLIGLVITLLAAYSLSAQSEGKITYQVKINIHRTLPPDRQEMKEMVPEFNIVHDKLVFKENESYYTPVEEEPDEEESTAGGMRMKIRRPEIEYYFNNAQLLKITYREFFGKHYLIKDSIRISPWKMQDETKNVGGYLCKRAAYTDTVRNHQIVAWYTDKIKAFLGPEAFNTLPGTVLQVDINNGERVITAEKIEFVPLKKSELKIPSGGIQLNESEFAKIVEDTHKKMGQQGGIIIRTN
jgi:GLPGLI family protein